MLPAKIYRPRPFFQKYPLEAQRELVLTPSCGTWRTYLTKLSPTMTMTGAALLPGLLVLRNFSAGLGAKLSAIRAGRNIIDVLANMRQVAFHMKRLTLLWQKQ